MDAAHVAHRIPRRTAATHLARLVRFGEVVQLANHSYVVGSATSPLPRAILEYNWLDEVWIIRPDGAVERLFRAEFRVAWGRIEHFEIPTARPTRQFVWTSTVPSRVSKSPSSRTSARGSVQSVQFAKPLDARNTAWQRYFAYADLPRSYRMSHDPKERSGRQSPGGELASESEGITTESQNTRYGYRVTPNAHLRLQVVLPRNYPIGFARYRVRYLAEPAHVDVGEESRLSLLAKEEWGQDGFRRAGATLTLSVPRFQLDRRYEIEWGLPTPAQRDRWLGGR